MAGPDPEGPAGQRAVKPLPPQRPRPINMFPRSSGPACSSIHTANGRYAMNQAPAVHVPAENAARAKAEAIITKAGEWASTRIQEAADSGAARF
jgi:hypothetical protein